MEERVTIEVKHREKNGKADLKKLRQAGLVPAILYGYEQRPTLISLNCKEIEKIIKTHGDNVLLSLKNPQEVEAESSDIAMIKEIQREPVLKSLLHIDLYKVSLKERITTRVPVRVMGDHLVRKRSGGITELIIRELEIRCLPTNIPHYIVADVSELNIGNTLHVRDLKVEEGVEILTEADRTVVTIVPPSKVEEPILVTPEVAPAAEEEAKAEQPSQAEEAEPDKEA
jgi:large subunit ribosomal protein L25